MAKSTKTHELALQHLNLKWETLYFRCYAEFATAYKAAMSNSDVRKIVVF